MLRRLALGFSLSAAALVLATGAAAAIGLTASNFGFTLTITGADQTPSFSFPMSATGTNGAFNITASTTQFQVGGNSLGFPTLTGITTGACTGGGCQNATNTIATYPIALNGTAQKIYSTANAKGTIPLTANLTLSLPGNAYTGAYTSTFTLTIANGP
jgi:hypothetical protein